MSTRWVWVPIGIMLIAMSVDFTLAKHDLAHQKKVRKVHYFALAEDFRAAKAGDTLYGSWIQDTLDLEFGDCPGCDAYILLGN